MRLRCPEMEVKKKIGGICKNGQEYLLLLYFYFFKNFVKEIPYSGSKCKGNCFLEEFDNQKGIVNSAAKEVHG